MVLENQFFKHFSKKQTELSEVSDSTGFIILSEYSGAFHRSGLGLHMNLIYRPIFISDENVYQHPSSELAKKIFSRQILVYL